jgi:hypothetical protein
LVAIVVTFAVEAGGLTRRTAVFSKSRLGVAR